MIKMAIFLHGLYFLPLFSEIDYKEMENSTNQKGQIYAELLLWNTANYLF